MSAPKIYCRDCEYYQGYDWYEAVPHRWCTVLAKEHIDQVDGTARYTRVISARLMRKLPWCNPKEKGE